MALLLKKILGRRLHRYESAYRDLRTLGGVENQNLSDGSHFQIQQRRRRFHSSASSLLALGPVGNEQIQPEERTNWRPMTIKERVLAFPNGAKNLIKELALYKNIHDASRTELNAWTLNHPFKKEPPTKHYPVYADDEIRPGRIPRRQHEQQRRIMVDFGIVVPVLAFWALPFIGNLLIVPAALLPRQFLSRQFHNEYEIYRFIEIQSKQRRAEYDGLVSFFGNMTVPFHRAQDLVSMIPCKGQDAAGPIVDALPLYSVFANNGIETPMCPRLRAGVFETVNAMPRVYLVKLALAIGVHQTLPSWMSIIVTNTSPTLWLQYRIKQSARILAEDDGLLLLEDHDDNGCATLTDIEVLDACSMRGLPVDLPTETMRECLANHLRMIDSVKRRLPPDTPVTEGFGLFALHLPIIRDYLKKHKQQ